MNSDPRTRYLHLALDVVGVLLIVEALRMAFARLDLPVGVYDEGIHLTNAALLRAGEIPYRDFYSNYPPGIFAVIAGVFAMFGQTVAAGRWLQLVILGVVAAAAGRLSGALCGRRLSLLASGLSMLWLVLLPPHASSWTAGLATACMACVAIREATLRGDRARFALAGFVFGAISWFRHDLWIYAALGLGVVVAVQALQKLRGTTDSEAMRFPGWMAGGAIVAVALFWLPLALAAGVDRIVGDLFLEQIRYIRPARVLPLPPLFALQPAWFGGVPLPVAMHKAHAMSVALTLAGPLLAAAFLLRPARGTRSAVDVAAVLAFAVVPQILLRSDIQHSAGTTVPALCFLVALVHRLVASQRGSAIVTGLGLVVLLQAPFPPSLEAPAAALKDVTSVWWAGLPDRDAADRRAAVEFIRSYSRDGDPVYVGVVDHRRIFLNEMILYFQSGRRGAVREMQFDPNFQNRLEVQQGMVHELDCSGARVAVLVEPAKWFFEEPNASRDYGADVLDKWLEKHFETVGRAGRYHFLLRSVIDTDCAR